MQSTTVHQERRGQVLILTIDRPHVRNALDHATLYALHDLLTSATRDTSVRALVLTGSGDRAFSAGLDLSSWATDGLPDDDRRPVNLLRDGTVTKPVLAAVNGAAVGGGFELAMACDLRIAATHAFFALPEVSRGIVASEGGADLPLHIPTAMALELGLTGDPIDAARALSLGLVNRVVPGEEVLETTVALAERISSHSPAAVAATKRLMYGALGAPSAQRSAANRTATAELLAGPDAAEGMAAFLAKRAPTWADPV